MFEQKELSQFVTLPTRNKAILDIVLVPDRLQVSPAISISPIAGSDHFSQIVDLFYPSRKFVITPPKFYKDYNKTDLFLVNSLISLIDWTLVFKGAIDVDDCVQAFMRILTDAIDSATPISKSFIKHKTRFTKFTMKLKHALWRRAYH